MEISQILYWLYCHRLYCFGNFIKFPVLAWNDTFHLIFFVPTSNARWSCLVIKTFERCYIDIAQLPKCKFCKPSHTMYTFSIYLFILTFCLYFLTLNPWFVFAWEWNWVNYRQLDKRLHSHYTTYFVNKIWRILRRSILRTLSPIINGKKYFVTLSSLILRMKQWCLKYSVVM